MHTKIPVLNFQTDIRIPIPSLSALRTCSGECLSAFKQCLKLLASDLFLLHKQLRTIVQYLLMRFEHRLSFFVCVIDQALDFLIYDRSNLLTVRAGMCQIPSDKHLSVVIVIIDSPRRSDIP